MFVPCIRVILKQRVEDVVYAYLFVYLLVSVDYYVCLALSNKRQSVEIWPFDCVPLPSYNQIKHWRRR